MNAFRYFYDINVKLFKIAMKQENWFCTPVWFEYLTFDTQRVARKCLQLREQNYSNRILSNRGGWQSEDIDLNEFEEFLDVSRILEQKIAVLAKFIDSNLNLKLDNVWINLNERGDSNKIHVHPVASMSGTIYIQVDENTGKIIFHDDHFAIKHYPLKVNSRMFNQYVTYTPRNGMILFFPAWIPHEVTSSGSDMTRISISFNIKQVN